MVSVIRILARLGTVARPPGSRGLAIRAWWGSSRSGCAFSRGRRIPKSAPPLACTLRGDSRVPRMAVVPVSLLSYNCHRQDLTLGLGWPESPAADLDSPGDSAIMPTPSESRVTVSGEPSKAVEL